MRLPFFSSKRLGIDLGTSNCLVWSAGEGVVLAEPSVVAVDAMTGKVVAVGSEAREMLGRTGSNLIAQKPLKDGVVADFLVCQAMLKYFMNKVLGSSRFVRPEMMVCVPSGITQVERRAVLEAALVAGAKTAYLIDQSLAAAIGAKLPIEAAFGSMVVDIGGGQSGAAVVSLGGIVASVSAKVGGNKIDEAIIYYLRRQHNLIIGERMAEDVKIKIGAALLINPKKTMEVRGRDAVFLVWFGAGSLIKGGREAQIKSAKNIAITTVQTGKKDSQFESRLQFLLVSAIWQNSRVIVVGEVFKNPPKDFFLLPVWGKSGPKMPLLIGESVYEQPGQKLNQVVAYRFGKGIVASAWKSSIVPFGEHFPWLAGGVLRAFGQNNYLEKYKNSREVAAGGGDNFNVLVDKVRIGALSCGAFITASGSRSLVPQGVQILVAPASWQVFHQDQSALEMAIGYLKMRSIEFGKPVVQASHEGENFVAYPDGSINRSGSLGDRVLNFKVAALNGVTIYHRFGDWVPVVAAIYLFGFVLLKRKKF